MSTFPTIPPGMGWPFVDATTGEFQSSAVNAHLNATIGWLTAPAPSGGDDSSALTASAGAAATFGLGLRLRAGGTYKVRPGGLRLTGATRRYIDGGGATLKLTGTNAGTTMYPALLIDGSSEVIVTNLRIDGSDDVYASTNWWNNRHGLRVQDCDRVTVDNVVVWNYPSVAVTVQGCTDVAVRRVKATDGQYHAVAVEQCERAIVSNCVYIGRGDQGSEPNAGGCGIIFIETDVVVAEDNYIQESSDSGLKAEACSDVTYRGNRVIDAGKDGIKAGGYSAGSPSCERIVATGNTVLRINAWRDDGSSLMQFYDARDVVAEGNILIGGGDRTHPTAGTLPEDGIRVFNIYSSNNFTRRILIHGNVVRGVANAGLTAYASARDLSIQGNWFEGWIDIQGSPLAGDSIMIAKNTITRDAIWSANYAIRVNGFSGAVSILDNAVEHYLGLAVCSIKGGVTAELVRIAGNSARSCHNRGVVIANYSGVASTIKLVDLAGNDFVDITEGAAGWCMRLEGTNLSIPAAGISGNRIVNTTGNAVTEGIVVVGTAGAITRLDLNDNAMSGTITNPISGMSYVTRVVGLSNIGAPNWGTWAVGDVVRNSTPTEAGSTPNKYVVTGWVCITAGSPGTWVAQRVLTGN